MHTSAKDESIRIHALEPEPKHAHASIAPKSSLGRIPELDGIRGLAILMVLIYHCANFEPAKHSFAYYLLAPRALMWSGVDLFFVLSGFLIGGILMDSKNSPTYYPTFYLRRIHRIFPLYYLMISLFMAGSLLFPGSFLFTSRMPTWPYPFFFQNIGFGFTGAAVSVGVTWSLAVEEQFYLLLPLAVRTLSRRAIFIVAIVCIASAPILRTILSLEGLRWDKIHALLPCRADALALGVLAAMLVRNEAATRWVRHNISAGYVCFAILLCGPAAMLKFEQTRFIETLGISLLDLLYVCLLILVLVAPVRPMTWIFRGKWIRWLGTVSYCVYLIHPTVLASVFRIAGYSEPSIVDFRTFSLTAIALVVMFYLAQLSWKYLESPLNRRAHRLYNY
jgi:peptidoglycan/LPS O-acetylase OafA/YrhL